jgi:peptidylprolyl isomerase domain and WD repeat-containing protein 1
MYERSYMHREVISAIKISKTNFIVTTSNDGSLKFWKKVSENIEFVKHYKAHLGLISDVQFSHDGLSLATCSIDNTIKVFDVINFDMTNLIRLDFTPSTLCWIVQKGQLNPLIAW